MPGISCRELPWRRQDLPSSWGTPIVRLPMFFDPGRTACSRPVAEQQRGPRCGKDEGSHDDERFRGSIAWLSGWLRAPCEAWSASPSSLPHPTQDSLPAAGQALPDGLSTRRVSAERFQSCLGHLILLSQACLAQFQNAPPDWLVYAVRCP